ncbi:hypothetical protein [Mycobacterium sp.]
MDTATIPATTSSAFRRRAPGYRHKAKMITFIHLIAGKLPLPQIHAI